MWRLRPPKLDRLTARLAVGVSVLVVVPLAAGLFVLSRYHFDQTLAARRAAAELENRSVHAITNSLAIAQLLRNSRNVEVTLTVVED